MEPRVYEIKSLAVQDTIMLVCLGVVILLLIRGAVLKRPRHVLVFGLWVGITLWFFNSPFFGFSAVSVGEEGVRVDYGILSFRNTVLPLSTPWKVESRLSGVKKTKRLYFLKLGRHESMKVERSGLPLLNAVGSAIDRFREESTHRGPGR